MRPGSTGCLAEFSTCETKVSFVWYGRRHHWSGSVAVFMCIANAVRVQAHGPGDAVSSSSRVTNVRTTAWRKHAGCLSWSRSWPRLFVMGAEVATGGSATTLQGQLADDAESASDAIARVHNGHIHSESNMKAVKVFALAAAGVLVTAGSASAQAYFGTPVRDGGFAVRAEVGFPDGGNIYDAVLDANLLGPISFQLFGGLLVPEGDASNAGRFGGKLGYALPFNAASLGIVAGVEYQSMDFEILGEEFSMSQTIIPVGVGIGVDVPLSPTADAVLYAQPALMHIRASLEGESDSTNEFGIDAGAKVGVSRFVLGGSLRWINLDGADAVFALTAGIRF